MCVKSLYCAGCTEGLIPADPEGEQTGVAECINQQCPTTLALIRGHADFPTLRCGNCGDRHFLRKGSSYKPKYCRACGEDIVLSRPAVDPAPQQEA
jgi:hypothetical protein